MINRLCIGTVIVWLMDPALLAHDYEQAHEQLQHVVQLYAAEVLVMCVCVGEK